MSPPFQTLLASVDRRRTPREVSSAEVQREADRDMDQDHIGSGTQPAFSCRWAALGMTCDCLQCVTDKARAR